ncbi:MAG: amidohydrolase/deacetylase family metallohydrolase [Clostridium sp.]
MKNIVIKNAKLINGQIKDIELLEETILKIEDYIQINEEHEVIDLKCEKYISAGWIDMHTHCFNKYKLYSDNPDEIGYKKGVTTVVDAGTAGADTIKEFYQETKKSKTNVLAYINVARQGIATQDELSNLENLNEDALIEAYNAYRDFIVGIKVRMSKSVVGDSGIEPLRIARGLSDKLSIPLMVHIGSEPPKLDDVLNQLKKNDIISHVFNGKQNGILNHEGKVKEEIKKVKREGIFFDLAHGTDSFNFKVCEIAKKENIKCDVITTDIYEKNRVCGPVFDLPTTMSKLLNVGYTLDEVIKMVTENPSRILNKDSLGKLEVGAKSDLTIFEVVKENKELIDSNNNIKIAKDLINPLGVILNGKYIEVV